MFLEFLGSYREFQVWKYFTYMNCFQFQNSFYIWEPLPSAGLRGRGRPGCCARGLGQEVTGVWDTSMAQQPEQGCRWARHYCGLVWAPGRADLGLHWGAPAPPLGTVPSLLQ